MLVRAPMRIQFTSPRITTPGQTLESTPIETSPITTAATSIYALPAICGAPPPYFRIIDDPQDSHLCSAPHQETRKVAHAPLTKQTASPKARRPACGLQYLHHR